MLKMKSLEFKRTPDWRIVQLLKEHGAIRVTSYGKRAYVVRLDLDEDQDADNISG